MLVYTHFRILGVSKLTVHIEQHNLQTIVNTFDAEAMLKAILKVMPKSTLAKVHLSSFLEAYGVRRFREAATILSLQNAPTTN
jgi:hypothetical protein